MPALSRYSNRRSIGAEVAGSEGAPLTEYSALFRVAVSVSFDVRSVKGSGCVGRFCSMSSCGCLFESRKCFKRQLLSRAPRLVNTATTSRVSTRTSRSAASLTTGAAVEVAVAGGNVAATADEVVDGVDGPGVVLAPLVSGAEDDAPGAFGTVFGTGLTNSACHVYRTIKVRKIARRTRRSI